MLTICFPNVIEEILYKCEDVIHIGVNNMNGTNKTNAMFVVIAAVVLLAGTAIPVVYAGDSDSTEVIVTVEGDDPMVTIEEYEESISHDGTQVVEVRIETASEDNAIDGLTVELEYSGSDEGDATTSAAESEYDPENWEDGVYEDTFEFSDDFWRYANDVDADTHWEITASADVAEDYIDEDATDTAQYNVEQYLSIDSAVEEVDAEGQPGETLSTGDFEGTENGITIISNANWDLVAGDLMLTDDEDNELSDTEAGYDGDFSDIDSYAPVNGESYDIEIEVHIPYGQAAGEYSGDLEHNLGNAEVE